MKYINYKIKANVGSYPLDEIDCFERIIGLCLNSYNDQYSDIFFLVWCFARCYNINYGKTDSPLYKEAYLIKKLFNLELCPDNDGKNLVDRIENKLLSGNPVMVPVNLKEIFYADQYKEVDWPHLFAIKVIDKGKGIFFILDNTHLKSDKLSEHDFVIPFKDLVAAHDSYFSNIEKNSQKYFLHCSDDNMIPISINEAFDNCLNIMLNNSSWEFAETKALIDLKRENSEKINSIINIPKSKKLFHKLLLEKMLLFKIIEQDKYDKMLTLSRELTDEWQRYINICYKRLLSSGKIDVPSLSNIEELEGKFRSEISLCYTKNIYNIASLAKEEEYVFENDDGTVMIRQGENIAFNFNSSKLYNSWIEDKSPKVSFGSGRKFQFSIIVKVLKNEEADFVAGIFFRVDGNLYYFGIDSCRRLNLDKAQFESSICQLISKIEAIELKVSINAGIIKFYYKDICTKNNAFVLFHKKNIGESIVEFGIGCKTYNSPKPLKVLFENIQTERIEYD